MKKLLLIPLLCLPLLGFSQNGLPTEPYIYVVGDGQAVVQADTALFNFEISETDLDQNKAKAAVNQKAAEVFKLIEAFAIKADDFEAFAISSTPRYAGNRYDSEKPPQFLGYQVTRTFSIKLRELSKYATMLDRLFELKLTGLNPSQPTSSKEALIQAEAADKALENARAKAEITAKKAGMRIKSVYAISPTTFPDIIPTIFQSSRSGGVMRLQSFQAKSADGDAYAFPPISASSTIHVIYLIEPDVAVKN